MRFAQIRNLLAVARQGGIRSAARELGLAQPALTRSIHDLERELDVPLFERRPTGLIPTAIGAAFIRRATTIDNELARARDEIAQMRGATNGHVRVAMSTLPHMGLLPDIIGPLLKRYPDIRLDIQDAVFPSIVDRMLDGSLDLYIGPPPEQLPDGLLSEKILESTRVVVCRRGHPLAKASSLRDLVDAKWISTSITSQVEQEFKLLFDRNGLPEPKIVLQAHSALTINIALTSTDLLAMLPVIWTQFELTKNLVQAIKIKEDIPAPALCVIRRSGLPLTPAAQHFCDLAWRAVAHVKGVRPMQRRTDL